MRVADWFDQRLDEALECGKAEERKNAEEMTDKLTRNDNVLNMQMTIANCMERCLEYRP